jgi:predicted lipoprotein with Yx(FWY)xxD motif
MNRRLLLAPAAGVLALGLAACGGNDEGGGAGSATTANPAPAAKGAATVAVRDTDLGRILVDASGRTLYLFEKDTGPPPTCFGACAGTWPPYTTNGKPRAGSGAKAALIGTSTRKGGQTQVTYAGHPLYYYIADSKPGDTNGQELDQFGAEWYVVSPSGKKVEGEEEPPAASGGDGSGY